MVWMVLQKQERNGMSNHIKHKNVNEKGTVHDVKAKAKHYSNRKHYFKTKMLTKETKDVIDTE